MKGATLFSGIGTPELAAPEIDWRWCAEIDPFASAVLATRFPHIRNLGDVTAIDETVEPVDLIVCGPPCQSFSVAGKRGGLADRRGDLAFFALAVVFRVRPRWVVLENVPGLLSSDSGRDFGAILGALADFGYGLAYRVLDAQYWGVPQRRRRVFVVGCLGDWRGAAAVLFERGRVCWDPPTRRQPAQRVAPTLESRPDGRGSNWGTDFLASGGLVAPLKAQSGQTGKGDAAPLIAFDTTQITHPENRSQPQPGRPCHPLAAAGHPPAIAFTAKDHGQDAGDLAPTLRGLGTADYHNGGGQVAIIVPPLVARSTRGSAQTLSPGFNTDGHIVAEPLSVNGHTYTHEGKVFRLRNVVDSPPRRLTPRECERLQGLPDDWTLIRRGKRRRPAADGPRYRAIGNAMAAPVVRWILDRLRAVDHSSWSGTPGTTLAAISRSSITALSTVMPRKRA